jgi:hypothetical protein
MNNTEQLTELKAALQDVARGARRDGRHLDSGIVEAAISALDAPRLAAAEAAALASTPARRGRGRPKSNGADAPASVSDLTGRA